MNDNRGIHGIPGHNSVVTRKFLDALKSRGESPEFTIAKSYRWSRKMSPPDSIAATIQIRINNLWIWSQIPVLEFSLLFSFSEFRKECLKFSQKLNEKNKDGLNFFFLPFFFVSQKKKKKKESNRAALLRTRRWCTKLAHRILSIDSSKDIGVEWSLNPYYTIHEYQWTGDKGRRPRRSGHDFCQIRTEKLVSKISKYRKLRSFNNSLEEIQKKKILGKLWQKVSPSIFDFLIPIEQTIM